MIKTIKQRETGEVILTQGRWCASYLCRLRGLMFRGSISTDEGLIFVHKSPSIVNTTIHMFFMFFPISVVWLDAELQVVDAKFAKPWRPAYAPAKPAVYYIEAHPNFLDRVKVGDVLVFE